jgi:hypothetical protein
MDVPNAICCYNPMRVVEIPLDDALLVSSVCDRCYARQWWVDGVEISAQLALAIAIVDDRQRTSWFSNDSRQLAS